jgi:hypothetical protein
MKTVKNNNNKTVVVRGREEGEMKAEHRGCLGLQTHSLRY